AMDGARARGAAIMHLEVRESNLAALKLYHRHQFAEIGRRKAYYRGIDGRVHDAITMQRQITA
ncbi:MAG: ribosomal-protein-alanine acetyltransferase, partial [Pacificimonas sp.]